MQLRLAEDADAEAIRAIYNAEVVGSSFTFDLVPRSAEQQRAWMAEHRGAYPAVVAVEGDLVIGFSSLSPYRSRPGYSTTVEDSVYVESSWRGKGVGKALLAEVVGLARAHGFHAVMARIVADHVASIGLHGATGFELVGVEREIGRKFGRWLDVAVMELLV